MTDELLTRVKMSIIGTLCPFSSLEAWLRNQARPGLIPLALKFGLRRISRFRGKYYLAAALTNSIHCSSVTFFRASSKTSMLTPLVILVQLTREMLTGPLFTTSLL